MNFQTVDPADPAQRPAPPSWPGAVLAGLLATLEQPSGWAVALAGFLARGGLLAFLLPILVLPTPAGLQAQLSPLLRPLVFGEPSPGLLLLLAGAAALVAAGVVLGGLIGAWADVLLIGQVSTALESPSPAGPGRDRRPIGLLFLARSVAHLPLIVALAWGAVRIFEVSYRELLTPFEVVTPLVIRIVTGAPDALAVIAIAWWLGEAAGGLAAREIVLGRRGLLAAVLAGWRGLVRRPFASAATLLLTTGVMAVAILPALVAAGSSWSRLRTVLYESTQDQEIMLALGLFVALWLGGLVLAGVATAGRSALWTAEWLRRQPVQAATTAAQVPDGVGTIGHGHGTDRGGWPTSEGSGTL